jgi:hypothetical protein
MGETLAIPLAATDDRSVITTHSGGSKHAGIRQMRVEKQNLAYEIPKVHYLSLSPGFTGGETIIS